MTKKIIRAFEKMSDNQTFMSLDCMGNWISSGKQVTQGLHWQHLISDTVLYEAGIQEVKFNGALYKATGLALMSHSPGFPVHSSNKPIGMQIPDERDCSEYTDIVNGRTASCIAMVKLDMIQQLTRL